VRVDSACDVFSCPVPSPVVMFDGHGPAFKQSVPIPFVSFLSITLFLHKERVRPTGATRFPCPTSWTFTHCLFFGFRASFHFPFRVTPIVLSSFPGCLTQSILQGSTPFLSSPLSMFPRDLLTTASSFFSPPRFVYLPPPHCVSGPPFVWLWDGS